MHTRSNRSDRQRFPENIVDPLVKAMFDRLENLVWRGVLWVFDKTGINLRRDHYTQTHKQAKR